LLNILATVRPTHNHHRLTKFDTLHPPLTTFASTQDPTLIRV
jgi:hypothetical protein